MATGEIEIGATAPPAPAALRAALRDIVTSHLSDNLGRLTGIGGLTRYHRSARLVGTAFTVKTPPGDNLAIYKALPQLLPGHVLVVDAGGDTTNAVVGELIMLYAAKRGCAGFVIDGAIRDAGAFGAADFPCHARARGHRGPYKHGPARLNGPVAIGGEVVQPGDLIVGDEDGLVVFPERAAEQLIAAARRTAAAEQAIREEIANGRVEQSWIIGALEAHGSCG